MDTPPPPPPRNRFNGYGRLSSASPRSAHPARLRAAYYAIFRTLAELFDVILDVESLAIGGRVIRLDRGTLVMKLYRRLLTETDDITTLNGAEGTVPPGRVYKKVAIVENFFDIIHAVHVDLEGRPGKHAGQKRTYRTITETYAFLPREAVTRFLLGCTECQRRPRTPSPTNLSNQPQPTSATPLTTSTLTSTATPLSPNTLTTASTTSVQSSPKLREGNHNGEGKPLYSYRHQRHQKGSNSSSNNAEKADNKEKEEKYNPLSITNLLKKEPVAGSFLPSADSLPDSRRTPDSRSSASSKRKRMLPEGRTPSPQPSQPLPRPWSPGLDPKNTPIDYSLPITTSYLKHQQRLLQQQAEKNKAAAVKETELEQKVAATVLPPDEIADTAERDRYSPATGLIDTNLNLLATIQHLHCQVMLALTERLRPSITMPSPLVLPTAANVLTNGMMIGSEVSVQTGENRTPGQQFAKRGLPLGCFARGVVERVHGRGMEAYRACAGGRSCVIEGVIKEPGYQLNVAVHTIAVGARKNVASLRKLLFLPFFSPRAGKPISTRHPLSSYHLDFPLPQPVPSHFFPGFCLPWNNPVFSDNAYGDSS
ncbi:Nucleolar protein 4 [Melipona quadrifasciata]|uniref:Nucleolar protein 4 n=1 Tax=Melipona quadrifasciata TaxID=166423 RepID=A0A0M8ZSQ4_9HYME|nr:Nucleolar protein 4 [Melipona quadrifasciata]